MFIKKDFCILLLALGLQGRVLASDLSEETYKYDPTAKVDPFKPLELPKSPVEVTHELQNYEIKDLKLVGTLLGSEMSALILTPKSQGVIAKIGDKVGKNNGRIVLIDSNKLIIRQPVLSNTGNFSGGKVTKFNNYEDISITLSTSTGNGSGNKDGMSRKGYDFFNNNNSQPMMFKNNGTLPTLPMINFNGNFKPGEQK